MRVFVSLLSFVFLAIAPSACSASEPLFSELLNLHSEQANSEQTYSSPLDADQQAILQALAEADVVYLGETHDSAADHDAQLQIIQALYVHHTQAEHQESQHRPMAIAFEMFQRPYQSVLDRYLSGEIDEVTLREQSEYDQRWGFPWEFYAPILRFAREHQLPILALNAPSEVVRQVAQAGLASLNADDQTYIPPLSEIRTDNVAYRELIESVFGFAHHSQAGIEFDNFFAAQVVWDETMADRIAAFLTENPDYQVVVLAGKGHVMYGYGIPDRVERRLGEGLVQRTVLLNPRDDVLANADEGKGGAGDGAIADFFWLNDGDRP